MENHSWRLTKPRLLISIVRYQQVSNDIPHAPGWGGGGWGGVGAGGEYPLDFISSYHYHLHKHHLNETEGEREEGGGKKMANSPFTSNRGMMAHSPAQPLVTPSAKYGH